MADEVAVVHKEPDIDGFEIHAQLSRGRRQGEQTVKRDRQAEQSCMSIDKCANGHNTLTEGYGPVPLQKGVNTLSTYSSLSDCTATPFRSNTMK